MSERVIKMLEDGHTLIESDARDVEFCGVAGWISYWIVDKNDERVETFASKARAERSWEMNKDNLSPVYDRDAEKLARSLTRKMGIKWEKLSEEEKKEWMAEVSD